MVKQHKQRTESSAAPVKNTDKPAPGWLILLGQATAGAVAALAVTYTAYRLWITPKPSDSELAKVTVGYEIRPPEFLRSVMQLKFDCAEAETTQYHAQGKLPQFSHADGRVYISTPTGSQVDVAWVIFLRIDNYSESPLKNIVVQTSAGTTYSRSNIPPKSFAAYFVDAQSVADEKDNYEAVGSDKAVVTYEVATARGKVQSSLPREDVRQSNVAGCGPKARLLSPQRLDTVPLEN